MQYRKKKKIKAPHLGEKKLRLSLLANVMHCLSTNYFWKIIISLNAMQHIKILINKNYFWKSIISGLREIVCQKANGTYGANKKGKEGRVSRNYIVMSVPCGTYGANKNKRNSTIFLHQLV